MAVTYVVGIPCCGKSTFIQKHFPDTKRLDWFEYQWDNARFSSMIEAYQRLTQDIAEAAARGEDIVVEHTLFKKHRRLEQLAAIRKVSDMPVNLYVMETSLERFVENYKKRNLQSHFHIDIPEVYQKDMGEVEPYEEDEGFTQIFRVHDADGEENWIIE